MVEISEKAYSYHFFIACFNIAIQCSHVNQFLLVWLGIPMESSAGLGVVHTSERISAITYALVRWEDYDASKALGLSVN